MGCGLDELDHFLNAPTVTFGGEENINTFNVVDQYKGHDNEYPMLANMAYNFYAISAMSAEAARVFSRYLPYILLD